MKTWIEELYAIGARRPGSPAGAAAEDYVEDRFRELGLSAVARHPIPITYWRAESWSLDVAGGENIPAFYVPYTGFTDDHGVEGELVHIDPRRDRVRDADLSGRIVCVDVRFPMLRGRALKLLSLGKYDPDDAIPDGDIHPATWIRQGWELYERAVSAGARAFLGILVDQPGGHDSYYAPYGFREGDGILDKPLPALWVSKRHRERLRRLGGERRRVVVKLTGVSTPATTNNIIGEVTGETDEIIIVGCHHDSPFHNAVEDGSGMAVILGMAEQLARGPKLRRTILFLATAGHFYGSIGTRRFIAQNASILERAVAEIHVEHIAMEAVEENGELVPTGEVETAAIFTPYNETCVQLASRMLEERQLTRTLILGASGPLGDYPPTDGGDFHQVGIPVFNYISNPVYLLVDDDPVDRVAHHRLEPVRDGFLDLIRRLDRVDRAALRTSGFRGRRLFAAAFAAIQRVKAWGKRP